MNSRAYWRQKANPWVSTSVLVGGLISACLLVFIYSVEADINNLAVSAERNLDTYVSTD
jgi:hypothetical protein